jgi:hypothetical protein
LDYARRKTVQLIFPLLLVLVIVLVIENAAERSITSRSTSTITKRRAYREISAWLRS